MGYKGCGTTGFRAVCVCAARWMDSKTCCLRAEIRKDHPPASASTAFYVSALLSIRGREWIRQRSRGFSSTVQLGHSWRCSRQANPACKPLCLCTAARLAPPHPLIRSPRLCISMALLPCGTSYSQHCSSCRGLFLLILVLSVPGVFLSPTG